MLLFADRRRRHGWRMWTYQVVSDSERGPRMTDLGEPHIGTPAHRGDGFDVIFRPNWGMDFVRHEGAVGVRCTIIRTDDSGQRQACGGAIRRVEPLEISCDGAGFR
jgi:hypothetical protein